ncbi:MAG: glycosyltransferase [Gemmataceae bacterium]
MTARPIRVGFVLHAMQVAGAEMLVAQTIRRLGDRIDPTVLCLDFVGPLGEQLRSEGVEVVSLDRKPGRDWRLILRLLPVLNRRRIEVLHAHQYSPFFYAALAKPLAHRPPQLILTEHGRHFPDVVSPLRRAFNRLVLDQLADAVNACCQFSARALCEIDGFRGNRIEIIENGIDVARYAGISDRRSLREMLGLDPRRRYLIAVARFHPVKDHATLLKAFARLIASRPDIDLLLAGDGPLRNDLQQLAATLNIADRVRFLGVRADVPELLQAADVFALTSLSEAASLTLLEAMASGLPVVVTNVGGNPEIVRDGVDGLLVPRGDAEAAATALARIFDDAELARQLGASGRQRVRERYRLESTIERYWKLYQHFCR